MTTMNQILVESVHSNKSNNMVWAVYVQGNEQEKSYCKSPYKAMRFAFYLKKVTGCRIADNSLALLSLEIKRQKEAAKAASEQVQSDACISSAERKQARTKCKEHIDEVVEQFVEEHSVDNVLAKADEAKAKAKGKRKPSAKKAKEEVAA